MHNQSSYEQLLTCIIFLGIFVGGVIFFFIAKPVHNFVQNYKKYLVQLLHIWIIRVIFRYKSKEKVMTQTAIQWLEIEIKNEDHHTEGELGNACIDVNPCNCC